MMDLQMPIMGGLAAARAIRTELGSNDLPVIALTAGVLSEQRQPALDAGCDDFSCCGAITRCQRMGTYLGVSFAVARETRSRGS
jgi:CheY-like chemotaxis protein